MVGMARENRDWGYRRIQGALANLGHEVSRGTIANILKAHGLEPAERNRKTTWKEFLLRQWEVLVAADFFTIEVWTRNGLSGLWMAQVGRNLSDDADGFLMGKRYLIDDRDPLYSAEFLETLGAAGVKSVKLPPRSPNLNAHAERFVRTIKESCLDRIILFGEGSLRKAIHEFIAHYHLERNHQGLGNRLITPEEPRIRGTRAVRRRQPLGGMLNYYHRQAA